MGAGSRQLAESPFLICYYCGEKIDPPPDATSTCSPETCLRVLRREGGLNAEAAKQQGLITITGDERLAIVVLLQAS